MGLIKINDDLYYYTEEGIVISKFELVNKLKKENLKKRGISISKNVEYDITVDSKNIELSLCNDTKQNTPTNGFIVEVFSSGTDGRLSRMYKSPIFDIINEDEIRESYEKYFIIEGLEVGEE